MRNSVKSLFMFFLSAALAGCLPSGEDELRLWIADQRANTKPNVTPLTEPKKFIPESYSQGGAVEPFNPLKDRKSVV